MPILDRRRPQRRSEQRVADDDDEDHELPPYEPLECPLTNEAKRAIAELSNTRDVHRYQSHIRNSITHLGQSVMDINDVTRDCQDSLARMVAKRQESNLEKPQREKELEKHLASLEAEVPEISEAAEAAMRDLIDRQVQIDDDKAALAATVDYFQNLPVPHSRTRRGQQNGDEDGEEEEDEDVEMPPPDQSVIDTLRQHRNEKQREYERLNAYQRYALNNDYAGFKKMWHESFHGDNGPPVPNAKRWFDDAGNPVILRGQRDVKNEGGAVDEDEDDDLVIAGEVRDYRCPLSLKEFKEPYSNRVCNHTYEKTAIVEYLQGSPGRRAQCAVPGCEKEFHLKDFYLDNAILRKMKRAQELQRLAEQEGSSSADEDDNASRGVKQERHSESAKRKVEATDDDDEEEDEGV